MVSNKAVRNVMALTGLILMFLGIVLAALGVLLTAYHWTVGNPVMPWLYVTGVALCALLAGSFLMEYGGIKPMPDKR
ncbi:TPA: hypothetical protein ACHKED_003976 [Escherichia coli]|uniref:hypothetical protein n=1 Tax=Escherichia coli TaxID=562 RepID=UPI0010CC913F|nr:hypothetical protein [Escherichia coli]HBC3064730.1 hypothetical protein [Escherichia coli O146]HDQ6781246.1 hypothetical protein [Escherichia coli O113:H4]HDQ6808593.1 hypothetical protein [Escherichia coli O22:H16]HDQ6829368.1 hypothetical protein [Escherichia coli O128:H2]EEQ2645006.1 hypothetical protein [Escherichia coli]